MYKNEGLNLVNIVYTLHVNIGSTPYSADDQFDDDQDNAVRLRLGGPMRFVDSQSYDYLELDADGDLVKVTVEHLAFQSNVDNNVIMLERREKI
jgi:hypothetical protein